MNAKKCDRCNSFYDPYKGIKYRTVNGELYGAFKVVLANSCVTKNIDMCPDCMKETITFLGLGIIVERSEEE